MCMSVHVRGFVFVCVCVCVYICIYLCYEYCILYILSLPQIKVVPLIITGIALIELWSKVCYVLAKY